MGLGLCPGNSDPALADGLEGQQSTSQSLVLLHPTQVGDMEEAHGS